MTYKGAAGTEEHTYLNSQWDTTDAPGKMQRPQARRAQLVVPPSSPSSSSSSLSVPPQRAAQAVAKAQHGLRATRSRLSINSLPNLLKEKTDELDLDYREINVNELDLEEKPVGKYARRYQPLAMLATTDCLRARVCCVSSQGRVWYHLQGILERSQGAFLRDPFSSSPSSRWGAHACVLCRWPSKSSMFYP
jgi:hypothetical protein